MMVVPRMLSQQRFVKGSTTLPVRLSISTAKPLRMSSGDRIHARPTALGNDNNAFYSAPEPEPEPEFELESDSDSDSEPIDRFSLAPDGSQDNTMLGYLTHFQYHKQLLLLHRRVLFAKHTLPKLVKAFETCLDLEDDEFHLRNSARYPREAVQASLSGIADNLNSSLSQTQREAIAAYRESYRRRDPFFITDKQFVTERRAQWNLHKEYLATATSPDYMFYLRHTADYFNGPNSEMMQHFAGDDLSKERKSMRTQYKMESDCEKSFITLKLDRLFNLFESSDDVKRLASKFSALRPTVGLQIYLDQYPLE